MFIICFWRRLIHSELHLCHQFNLFRTNNYWFFKQKSNAKIITIFHRNHIKDESKYWKGRRWYAWLRQQNGNNKVFKIGMMQLCDWLLFTLCEMSAIIIGLLEATHRPSDHHYNEANELHNCTILIDTKQINKSINNKWTKFFRFFPLDSRLILPPLIGNYR